GKLRLGSFALAIAIDCSRSMRAEIDRLKRDMRVMFASFELIAREVGVGVTPFAPGGLVKHLPLTGDLPRLMAYVNAADIFGPAGEEEWAGALATAVKGSRWPAAGQYSRRAIVLISDEPITQPQFDRAIKLARSANKDGFRIYGVMIRPAQDVPGNPLSIPFDRTAGGSVFDEDAKPGGGRPRSGGWGHYGEIAEATGGRAIEVEVPQGGLGLGSAPKATGAGKGKGGKQKAGRKGKRDLGGNADPMAIAPIYPGGGPTSRILTLVLTDAIDPRHADRIEPLVKIMVAYCQKAAARVPERRSWARPGPMEPNLK
ncbi:MAG: vWA domain-containing protein, partial [Phycisphaerae bacterium]